MLAKGLVRKVRVTRPRKGGGLELLDSLQIRRLTYIAVFECYVTIGDASG